MKSQNCKSFTGGASIHCLKDWSWQLMLLLRLLNLPAFCLQHLTSKGGQHRKLPRATWTSFTATPGGLTGCKRGDEWVEQAYNAGQVKTSVNRSRPQQKQDAVLPRASCAFGGCLTARNCDCHSNFELRPGWAGRVFRSTSRLPLKVLCPHPSAICWQLCNCT